MKRSSTFAALFLTVLVPIAARADDDVSTPVAVGTRVRVGTENGDHIEGILKSREDRALTIVQPGWKDGQYEKAIAVDPSTVTWMDQSIREKGRTFEGALVGALVGLAAPAVIMGSYVAIVSCEDCSFGLGASVGVTYAAKYTVPAGVLIGALVGHGMKTQVWERVDSAGRQKLSAAVLLKPAAGRGVGAGLALSWK